jgi:hypothetical protein
MRRREFIAGLAGGAVWPLRCGTKADNAGDRTDLVWVDRSRLCPDWSAASRPRRHRIRGRSKLVFEHLDRLSAIAAELVAPSPANVARQLFGKQNGMVCVAA